LEDFEQAIVPELNIADGSMTTARLNRAAIYIALKQYDKATLDVDAYFGRVKRLCERDAFHSKRPEETHYPLAYLTRGKLYEAQGLHTEAMADYKRVLEIPIDPQFGSPHSTHIEAGERLAALLPQA